MRTRYLALVLAATPLAAQRPTDPATVVSDAKAAHLADRIGPLERQWTRALSRDSSNRLARLGLATIAWLTHNETVAEAHYRALIPARDLIAAYAAQGLARLLSERELFLAGDSISAIAVDLARTTTDSALTVEALATRVRVSLYVDRSNEADSLLQQASALAPARDARLRAFLRCHIGEAAAVRGDSRAGVTHVLAGAALARSVGAARELGRCEFLAGNYYGFLFRSDSSLFAYERAVAAFREAKDRYGLAFALYSVAETKRLDGRMAHARQDAEEGIREGEATNHKRAMAWGRVTLAQISMAFGDLRRANQLIGEATRLFVARRDSVGQVIAAVLAANIAMDQNDIARARIAFDSSLVHARAGWRQAMISSWTGMAWLGVMIKDSALAFGSADSIRVHLARLGMNTHGMPASQLDGTMALRWGRYDLAEQIFRGRVANPTSAQGPRGYVSGVRLAEILMRQGRLDDAERELIAATEKFDAWRQSLTDRQLRQSVFQIASDMSDPDLGFASIIAALARDGRTNIAFDLVERGRARDLSDRLRRAAAYDTAAAPAVPQSSKPIALDALKQALPDDSTAILEYVTGQGDPTTLFLVTRTGARAYMLPAVDSLKQPIARLTALLESGADPRSLGQQLAGQVFGSALNDIGPTITRLIVVPDGPLLRLPFDVLVLPDGNYALQRFAITTAPAASVLAQLWQRESKASAARLAVIADPRFAEESSGANDTELFRSAIAGETGLPRLRGSAAEARAVSRYADGPTIVRRNRASEAWLKSANLSEYAVLHFATHALVDDAAIASTALALAPAENEDGFVRPAELAGLSLAAELVVLSACRTAGGAIIRGEGVQGLAAPLIAAGARAIAATWWPIGDEATVAVMNDFYREMADGKTAGAALRSAKLAALQRGAPAREWAAFTLVGDPFSRPPLRPQPPGNRWWLALFALTLATVAAYGVMRRRRVLDRTIPSSPTPVTHQR